MAKGEGSRGGVIIRHTRSGLPIYASSQDDKNGKPSTTQTLAKSAAFIGTGTGLGVYVGRKSASLVKQGKSLKYQATKHTAKHAATLEKGSHIGPLFTQGEHLESLKGEVKTFSKLAKQTMKAGFKLKTIGSLIAGTLIGIGVNEALKDREEVKDNKKAQALAVAAPGVLGAIATGAGFYKKLGGKRTSYAKAAKFAIKNLLIFK